MAESFLPVRVNLRERTYEIRIGAGVIALTGQFLKEYGQVQRAVIITDEHVERFHAEPVARSLKAAGAQVDAIVLPSGEQTKCIAQADRLWNRLLELGADRQTFVVAVGGGVVGDLAGFVAASRYRGFPWGVDEYLDLAANAPWLWWASMDWCVEPEIAHDEDAILDRIIHRSHRIELKGESLRKRQAMAVAESLTAGKEK